MNETPEQAQMRMTAALPEFPRYGFYVQTGAAGYGPELSPEDLPAGSWEEVASEIAARLAETAELNYQGACAEAESAEEYYRAGNHTNALQLYRGAWQETLLTQDLEALSMNFARLADSENPAPLYEDRPELRHARIWDLIRENFPLTVSHNSRLYVWEATGFDCPECTKPCSGEADTLKGPEHDESCSWYAHEPTYP